MMKTPVQVDLYKKQLMKLLLIQAVEDCSLGESIRRCINDYEVKEHSDE